MNVADTIAASNRELAELLTRHHDDLKTCLEQWTYKQECLIANAIEQPSAEKQLLQSPVAGPEIIDDGMKPDAADTSAVVSSRHSSCHASIVASSSADGDLEGQFSGSKLLSILKNVHGEQVQQWEVRKAGCFQRFVHSTPFEVLSMAVILLNAMFMTYSADHTRRYLKKEQSKTDAFVELLLTGFYLLELIFRLIAERWYFFIAPYRNWNMLDLFLVCFSVQEFFLGQDLGIKPGFFRAVRLMKVLKMLRIVRILRHFRELRLIMGSMLGSMKTMLWSLILIFAICFMFSLFMMQTICVYMAENVDSLQPELRIPLDKYWSSVSAAMISLYMSSTGGDDWANIAEPLKAVGMPLYVCFLVYIAFFMFVIVNTLTSIFLEATIANAETDHKAMIRNEMKKKSENVKLIRTLFSELKKDGAEQITKEEFIANLQNTHMLAFLSRVGIDAIDAENFFDILDSSNSGARGIDIEEFVLACMKLKGNARSMDLVALMNKHDSCSSNLLKAVIHCQTSLCMMQNQLSNLTEAAKRADAKGKSIYEM